MVEAWQFPVGRGHTPPIIEGRVGSQVVNPSGEPLSFSQLSTGLLCLSPADCYLLPAACLEPQLV